MIRIFRTHSGVDSGFKEPVYRMIDAAIDIAIVAVSENTLDMGIKIIECILRRDEYFLNEFLPKFSTDAYKNTTADTNTDTNTDIGIDTDTDTDTDIDINIDINITLFIKGSKPELARKAQKISSDLFKVELFESLNGDFVTYLFSKYFNFILFFMAVGATVRLISKNIGDKLTDPGIVAIDEQGKFAVSLLSGHIGGANGFAKATAAALSYLNTIPVITTATDVSGRFSIDTFADKFNLYIEDAKYKIKKFNSASLRDELFIFFIDRTFAAAALSYKKIEVIKNYIQLKIKKERYILIEDKVRFAQEISKVTQRTIFVVAITNDISINESLNSKIEFIFLRPKNIVVGIGCNKNTAPKEIEEFVSNIFFRNNLSLNGIKNLASIDLKKNENGILKFGQKYGDFIDFFSNEEINTFINANRFYKNTGINNNNNNNNSDNINNGNNINCGDTGDNAENSINSACYKHTGAYSVSEPCAMLSANVKELFICKQKKGNVTMALAISEK